MTKDDLLRSLHGLYGEVLVLIEDQLSNEDTPHGCSEDTPELCHRVWKAVKNIESISEQVPKSFFRLVCLQTGSPDWEFRFRRQLLVIKETAMMGHFPPIQDADTDLRFLLCELKDFHLDMEACAFPNESADGDGHETQTCMAPPPLTTAPADGSTDVPCFVTLLQMAAVVNRKKSALRVWTQDPDFPAPNVKAAKRGQPDEWKWETVRPALEEKSGRQLPEVFPADRFIRQ